MWSATARPGRLADPVQDLARRRRDLVGCVGALAGRGRHGPRPADRAERRRLPAADLSRDRPRPRDRSVPTARRCSCGSTPRRRPGPRPGRSGRQAGTSSRRWCSSTTADLIAYCRRGGDYDPKTIGYIVRSESHDGGRTWSEGKDSAFPNPNAAVDFLKLRSGRLLLVFNDSMNRRTPLTAALSSDQDRTWPIRRNIREGNNDFGYPTVLAGPRRPHPSRVHIRSKDGRQSRGLRRGLGVTWRRWNGSTLNRRRAIIGNEPTEPRSDRQLFAQVFH